MKFPIMPCSALNFKEYIETFYTHNNGDITLRIDGKGHSLYMDKGITFDIYDNNEWVWNSSTVLKEERIIGCYMCTNIDGSIVWLK